MLPIMAFILALYLITIGFIDLIASETILSSHSTNYTLRLASSPYIVNSFVTFSSSAHIVIENGVQIILIGDAFISVFGSLNCGCSAHNTVNHTRVGLSNDLLFVHIFGNESMPTSTGIFINQQSASRSHIQFCNTLFDSIQNGIVTTSNQYTPYTVRNCEFRYMNHAIHHSTNMINFVFNSYFHHINNVKSAGGIVYDTCLFDSFGKFSFNTRKAINISIRNSQIYGDGVQICLNIYSAMQIHNNIISDCIDGIEIWNALSITNNTITNCTRYGVSAQHITQTNQPLQLKHNTFEHNRVSDIYLHDIWNTRIDIIGNTINTATLNFTQNITISRNIWTGNGAMIHVFDAQSLSFIENHISNSVIMTQCVLCVDSVDRVYITDNIMSSNHGAHGDTKSTLVSIQNANHCAISHNVFINNGIDAIHSTSNGNIGITHNTFANAVVYFEYMNVGAIALIEYNNFSGSSIHCIGGSKDYTISAHFNNFYRINAVEYVILAMDDVLMNADSNYFDDVVPTYDGIKSSIWGVCNVNISAVSESPIVSIDDAEYSECRWNRMDCDDITHYTCDSHTITPTVSPTASPTHDQQIHIEVTADVEIFSTEIQDDVVFHRRRMNNSILIILGSAGITLTFAMFGMILFCILFKLKKLKQETVDLNKQIKQNKHRSVSDPSSKKALKAESPRHPPPRHYDRRIPAAPKHDEDEKNDTEHFYARDNSSEMYDSIEGNETRNESTTYPMDDDQMIMNAINTAMTSQNIGELSVQFSQSAAPHMHYIKSESNFALKIDIGLVNHEEDAVDVHAEISEEETSASSASFTVKTESEQPVCEEHKIDMSFDEVMSPTETTQATPPTPQTPRLPLSPTLHPDQILHSLNFKYANANAKKQGVAGDTTPGMHSVSKLPIPKTKGQWM
eukprot:704550_1